MTNTSVGYAYLLERADIKALPLQVSARVMSVTKMQLIDNTLATPASLKPSDKILDHILFALKYEDLNLQILSQTLLKVSAEALLECYESAPMGKYIRIACLLWEHFHQQSLPRITELTRGNYIPLLDPKRFITADNKTNKRWRVHVNVIGSLDYSIIVKRTERLEKALAKNTLQKAKEFTDELDDAMLNRALSWVYLSETKDSFAIEKEQPDTNKIQRYTNLLRQAHIPRAIDEDYLAELQKATINNPYEWAVSYRNEQNYLSNGPGSIGVTYVPPSPNLCRELMQEWEQLTNQLPGQVDPIVLGAVISFGFVFLHPFMDGNGRLSRFMFHHVLCRSGQLANGLLLPVSAVLHNKEREYLATLSAYSSEIRTFWQVDYLDTENHAFEFKGHESIYRHWDGTACAELMAEACDEAMEHYIKQEVAYLNQYDALKRHINKQYDINDRTLSKLVVFCLEQSGKISKKRRDQFQYEVPTDAFDALEQAYSEILKLGSEIGVR